LRQGIKTLTNFDDAPSIVVFSLCETLEELELAVRLLARLGSFWVAFNVQRSECVERFFQRVSPFTQPLFDVDDCLQEERDREIGRAHV
jgi:hypothetical protein